MEELKYFKKIDNITEYVKNGIKSGKLIVDEVAKFARIKARQGIVGEEVITQMANGLEETKNTVKIDKITGEPGWIVTNPDGEEYIVEDSTFKKKYEIDPENPSQYKPKGGPVLSTTIDEHIEFDAPWGETMKIESGGSLILSGPNDIYGIQKAEFKNTYVPTGKEKRESLKEAISLLGISKEEFNKAKEERLKEARARIIKEEAEAKAKAKAKIPEWIKRGEELIYPERAEKWKECVEIRARDLYNGEDLDAALELMEKLESGASMEEVKEIFNDQGHSGTSAAIVRNMMFHFAKRGPEFCESTAYGKLSDEDKKAIADKKKENAELEELHKDEGTKETSVERREKEQEISDLSKEKKQLTDEISDIEQQLQDLRAKETELKTKLGEKQSQLDGLDKND